MCVLSKDKIMKLINKGKIRVEPFVPSNVGPASIDLRLGNEFRIFKKGGAITAEESIRADNYTKLVKAEKITINPGEFIHGITMENITLPENICGFLYGRSKYARLGIVVHATASFIQPGINNKQVLEIKNISPRKIVLTHGLRICQLILMNMKGRGKYTGGFAKQDGL
ncbi:MAG: dCTP deaminase [Candidatus Nanoarchaeia archaeon]|nr:dCTP deaminase [Candidatus Nanoarchaeia archaeon]